MARKLTSDLYDLLMMDLPLRTAMVVDFGIETNGHHTCLQRMVRQGATVDELDDAIGNGDKLNALVKKYDIKTECVFKTPYDELRNEVKKQIDLLEAKDVLSDEEQKELNILYEGYKEL
jgi:hypothetical protein